MLSIASVRSDEDEQAEGTMRIAQINASKVKKHIQSRVNSFTDQQLEVTHDAKQCGWVWLCTVPM